MTVQLGDIAPFTAETTDGTSYDRRSGQPKRDLAVEAIRSRRVGRDAEMFGRPRPAIGRRPS